MAREADQHIDYVSMSRVERKKSRKKPASAHLELMLFVAHRLDKLAEKMDAQHGELLSRLKLMTILENKRQLAQPRRKRFWLF